MPSNLTPQLKSQFPVSVKPNCTQENARQLDSGAKLSKSALCKTQCETKNTHEVYIGKVTCGQVGLGSP